MADDGKPIHFASGFLGLRRDAGDPFGVTNIFPVNTKLLGDFRHAAIMWLMTARVGNFPTLLTLTLPKRPPFLDLLGSLELRQLGAVQILGNLPHPGAVFAPCDHVRLDVLFAERACSLVLIWTKGRLFSPCSASRWTTRSALPAAADVSAVKRTTFSDRSCVSPTWRLTPGVPCFVSGCSSS